MRKLAFMNEKGGSCKTTLTVNVASYLAKIKKRKVLIIDVDPQAQATKCLGVDNSTHTLLDGLTGASVNVVDLLHPTAVPNLYALPSNKSLADWPVTSKDQRSLFRLTDLVSLISKVGNFDFIFFDAPPSLGIITTSILLAVNEVMIPVSMTYLALDGCAELVTTIDMIRSNYRRPDLKVTKIIPTLYRRTRLANEIHTQLRDHFGRKVTDYFIPFDVKIDEAQSHAKVIWDYAANSRGAQTIQNLSEEIIRKRSLSVSP